MTISPTRPLERTHLFEAPPLRIILNERAGAGLHIVVFDDRLPDDKDAIFEAYFSGGSIHADH